MKPIVAIVGRPNVGKSTLFNRIVGKRQALVDDTPGVTRDRQYAAADWVGKEFIVVDTGGLVSKPTHTLETSIKKQAATAINEADAIICVFDGREGPTHTDRYIVDLVRKAGKPVVYAVNKMDGAMVRWCDGAMVNQFYELGLSKGEQQIFAVSSEHGLGIDDLLDAVVAYFASVAIEPSYHQTIARIAVIGRPNVGKSTLINCLAKGERVIAHELAGTTRDSIDVEIKTNDRSYIFVDTAGIKKKGKTITALDKFSVIKALHSVERAKIVLVTLDATEGSTHQDLSLISYVYSEGKGIVVLVNKWDLVKKEDREKYEKFFIESFSRLHRVPFLCISAKTGAGVHDIFPEIERVSSAMSTRFSTSELNRMLECIKERHNLPAYRGHAVKLNYVTQGSKNPPTFIIFTNYPEGIPESYKRYLQNSLQELIGDGIPIRIKFKKK